MRARTFDEEERAALEAVLRPLAEARPLPSWTYLDEALFAWERETIFARSWRLAGREDDVALPGQFFVSPLTREGVLVARGADLEVRAFQNVCRHRAALLVTEDRGRAACFSCPYHGFRYELSGALAEAPGAAPSFDRSAHALTKVELVSREGFLFASPAPAAPFSPVPPWLVGLPKLARAHRSSYEVKANWKLCAENFQESLHFPRVHPALERLTRTEHAASWIPESGPWLGGVMDLALGVETVSTTGKLEGRALLVPEERSRKVHDALLFPTLFLSLQPDYLLTYSLHPLAVDRTRVVADVFLHAASAGRDLSSVTSFWAQVNEEDRAICQSQQVGAGARGFEGTGYLPVEDGVHAVGRLVARAYLEATSRPAG